MKKTISINIAGQIFKIDEDAFDRLKSYLDQITASFSREPGGEETISDIETRIAEIFGGGQEPPVVVTNEMISEMIKIMGAPEDYSEENASKGNPQHVSQRKNIYNPNSLNARAGRVFSTFWKSVGGFLYLIFRILMISVGSALALLGFVTLFSFVATFFFNGTPLVKDLFEPDILNLNGLLSIVLNSASVLPVIILTAIVVIIPLGVLTYLGIVMVFNLKNNSKIASIVIFSVWVASVAVLGVILSAKLSVYGNHKSVSARIELKPAPDTIYLAPQRKLSDLQGFEKSGIERICFYKSKEYSTVCGSPEVDIIPSDSTISYITIEKKASGKSDFEAYANVRNIDYTYRFSGKTLYADEFYAVRPGENWNGSEVAVRIYAREGTVIKCLPGFDPKNYGLMSTDRKPPVYKVSKEGFEEITY
jgi:hypothetical protein